MSLSSRQATFTAKRIAEGKTLIRVWVPKDSADMIKKIIAAYVSQQETAK